MSQESNVGLEKQKTQILVISAEPRFSGALKKILEIKGYDVNLDDISKIGFSPGGLVECLKTRSYQVLGYLAIKQPQRAVMLEPLEALDRLLKSNSDTLDPQFCQALAKLFGLTQKKASVA